MSLSKPRILRNRLEAIAATIPNIVKVLDGTEHEITAAMLPAVRVLPGRVLRRQADGAHRELVTRNFRFLLYVAPTNLVKPDENEVPDIEAAEGWLDVLPKFWRSRFPPLDLNGAQPGADLLDSEGHAAPQLVGVTDVGVMTGNDQPEWLGYRKQVFTGVVNDLPISYID